MSLKMMSLLANREPRRPEERMRTAHEDWLAAVGRVQAQTAFEFRDTSHEYGDLRRLRLVQRDQFFTGRNIWRFSGHPIRESESDPRVQENPLKITPPGKQPGQLPAKLKSGA